jgi:glycosyltransferase involved in cell wall biosynthesis
MSLIRVHVVTYRRPHLLPRAIDSLIRQSEPSWVAEVINDDPDDQSVKELIARIGDSRVTLSEPCVKRGGSGNFNYAFRCVQEPFAAILEDDNWWEPEFLETMVHALQQQAAAQVAVANEKVWLEKRDGTWEDTLRTIWPESEGVSLFQWRLEDKLGSAKLCNSAMLWRTCNADQWITPQTIPIDVTEHFRERVVPHPILLVHKPLVNYAVTLHTHRDEGRTSKWGLYQVMLIGSAFAKMHAAERARCAGLLWTRARTGAPPLKTSLITTGLAIPAARVLWKWSTFAERCRWFLTLVRRFRQIRLAFKAATFPEWSFLIERPFPVDSIRVYMPLLGSQSK